MMTLALQQDYWTLATDADKAQVLASLAALPSRDSGDATITRGMYYLALDGVTRHGLFTALKAISQGKLGHTFFPKPPELRLQCDKAMQPIIDAMEREKRAQREREEARGYKPIHRTEEQRARVRKAYEKFCQSYNEQKSAQSDTKGESYDISPEACAARLKAAAEASGNEFDLAKIRNAPGATTFDRLGRGI